VSWPIRERIPDDAALEAEGFPGRPEVPVSRIGYILRHHPLSSAKVAGKDDIYDSTMLIGSNILTVRTRRIQENML
jgi:hypothetical protein